MPGELYPSRKLGEVLNYARRPITPQTDQNYSLIGVRWYAAGTHLHDTIEGAKLQAPTLWAVREGDIIYNKMWTSKGAFAVVSKDNSDLFGTSEYPTFEPSAQASADFLRYAFRQSRFWQLAEAWTNGTTERARLNPRDFLRLRLPLPPIAEQRAIVEVLSAVELAIAKTGALCERLHDTTESLTEALCLGIDPSTGVRSSAKWRASTLAEEMASIQVGIVVRPASYYVPSGGVPALRSLNVLENRLQLNELIHISAEGHALNKKSRLCAGDIVTVRTGEPGTTAVVPEGFDALNCIDIIFSRPGPKLRGEYASFFMNSRVAKRQIAVLQGGLAQQHLNVGEMRRIKISVPPLGEQDRIVKLLRSMWQRIEAEEAELKQLETLRSALTRELLSGRLRLSESAIRRHRDEPGQAANASLPSGELVK